MSAPVSNSTELTAEIAGRQAPASVFSSMTKVDWVLVLLLCAILFGLSIHRSHGRLFWADELISHQIFSDPSFAHMLRAWYKGADSGGLTYYLVCPLWLRLFGLSELSLRLFSTAGMSIALALLWTALRRYVSICLTAMAVGLVFLTSPAMLWQEINGRFYGLFFAFAAFAALLFLLVTDRPRPSRSLLALLFVAHAGLVASHIFGLIFSFSLVAGTWAVDRIRHRTRWPVYLIPALGWLFVLISLPALRASASVVQKVFWTQRPGVEEFLYSFAGYGHLTAFVLGAVVCAAGLRLLLARLVRAPGAKPFAVPLAPAALVGSLVLAALLFFSKSQIGISIFADRYLLPLLIASAFLLAGALSVLLPRAITAPRDPAAAVAWSLAGLLPCCLVGYTRQTNYLLYPTADYLHQIGSHLEPGIPTVAALPAFALLHTYDPNHRYLFVTDWEYDDDPAHLADYSGERLMENWKKAGYLSRDILPCSEIFTRFPDVDLLIDQHLAPWFNDKVLHDPHLRVAPRGFVHEWDFVDVWSVERVDPGPPPC